MRVTEAGEGQDERRTSETVQKIGNLLATAAGKLDPLDLEELSKGSKSQIVDKRRGTWGGRPRFYTMSYWGLLSCIPCI